MFFLQLGPGLVHNDPQLLDAGQNSGKTDKMGLRLPGNNPRQGRLARSRRSPENHGKKTVLIHRAAQERPRRQELRLAHIVRQRPGPHAVRQRAGQARKTSIPVRSGCRHLFLLRLTFFGRLDEVDQGDNFFLRHLAGKAFPLFRRHTFLQIGLDVKKGLPAGNDTQARHIARLAAAIEKRHFMPQPGATDFQMIKTIHTANFVQKKKAVKRNLHFP